MRAGYAKIDITPPLGCILNGYYEPRYADHVIAPLYVTALACCDGRNTILAISLDISEILQRDTDDIRRRVAMRTGLPFEAVFVACIHTHTAPVISEIPCFFKRDPVYYEKFCEKICLCAQQALEDLQEAVASIARGRAEGISFVRRFRLKDGSTVTNPSQRRMAEVVGPVGLPDETVQLVKLRRKGAADIAIINFGTHPDVIGGTGICPDWPGFMRDALEGALADEADGKGVKVIFFNGAQGDVNHLDRSKENPPGGLEHARHMGRVVAAAVLSVYTYTEPVSCDRVFFRQRMAYAAAARGTPEQEEIARHVHEDFVAGRDRSGYPFGIVMARKFLRLAQRPALVPLNVVCVGFGDVAFVGLPGEPFTEIGRQIKSGSPFAMTIPCCNANGSEGYFPTDDALTSDGYESQSALFRPGVAPELIRTALEMLEQLHY